MCKVDLILNKKPKTKNPCDIVWLKPGEHMTMGRSTIIRFRTIFDQLNNKTSQGIVIAHYHGIFGKIKEYTQPVKQVIDLHDLCGLKATPLATSFLNKKQNGVLLFVEHTRTLTEILSPAS